MRKQTVLLGAVLCVGATLVLLWKPIRVLVPSWMGLTCPEPGICLEDITQLETARQLRADALAFVEERLGPINREPRVLFCSTQECFAQFAYPEWAAVNVGTLGMVVNAHRWEPYILRHEIIHLWQNETFGVLAASWTLPRWYIEGMAYELSEDPRATLPHPDPQGQRDAYRRWIAAGNDWRSPPK